VNERSFKDSIVLALKNRSRFAKTWPHSQHVRILFNVFILINSW
jgi:hypothetical protein